MSDCINPFQYFIDFVDYELSQDPTKTFADILNFSNVFQYNPKLCCPSCGFQYNDQPYVLSGNFDESDPRSFFALYNDPNNEPLPCCINTSITLDIHNLIKEQIGGDSSDLDFCCTPTNFNTSLNNLRDFLNSEEFNNYLINYDSSALTGIIEWNTINGDTLMNSIFEVLSNKPSEIALEYMFDILNNGLVIACLEDGVVITSIETYVTNFVDDPA